MCSPGMSAAPGGPSVPAAHNVNNVSPDQFFQNVRDGNYRQNEFTTSPPPQPGPPAPPAPPEALPAEAPMVIEAAQAADPNPKIKKRRTRRKAKSQSQQGTGNLAIPLNTGGPAGPGASSGGVGGSLSIPN